MGAATARFAKVTDNGREPRLCSIVRDYDEYGKDKINMVQTRSFVNLIEINMVSKIVCEPY